MFFSFNEMTFYIRIINSPISLPEFFRVTLAFEHPHDDAAEVEYSAAFQNAANVYEPLLDQLFKGLGGNQTAKVLELRYALAVLADR